MLRTGLDGMKCYCFVGAVEVVRERIVADPSADSMKIERRWMGENQGRAGLSASTGADLDDDVGNTEEKEGHSL